MSHELSLCGALARSVSALSGRGCDVDLIADSTARVDDAVALLDGARLDRYDAIVWVTGINDALRGTSAEAFRSSIATFLRRARTVDGDETYAVGDAPIFVVGAPPVRSIPAFDTPLATFAARHAITLNACAEAVCNGSTGTHYLPLPAASQLDAHSDRYRTAAQYEEWAAALSSPIAAALDSQIGPGVPRDQEPFPTTESVRQTTVSSLCMNNLQSNPTLASLVALARGAFRTDTALLSLIDGNVQRTIVHQGPAPGVIARSDSFCAVAIEQRGPLIVRDATLDDRFRDNELVAHDHGIRFYAGVPISAPSGERIGALCVVGSEARHEDDIRALPYLRELAVRVEQELWRVTNSD